jgi:ADP-L-glycero-D-manno-heptose 6-epimerase
MSVKYIVTGGAGFIGSNLVRELNARGETDILIVDELGETEKWKNLVGLAYEDYIDKGDLFDYMEELELSKVKAIYHLGACSATTETDADYLAYNNYHYTRALCETCLDKGIRFVYASSAASTSPRSCSQLIGRPSSLFRFTEASEFIPRISTSPCSRAKLR